MSRRMKAQEKKVKTDCNTWSEANILEQIRTTDLAFIIGR